MALELYANIAEIVGVVLVVASLIYVALQLRQNSDMLRAGHANDLSNLNRALINPLLTNRELAELWTKAESGFDELGSIEQRQMILFEWQAIQAWHNWFNLRERNLVSDYQWGELVWIFENLGKRQSVRAAWQEFRGSFTRQFQTFMAQYLD